MHLFYGIIQYVNNFKVTLTMVLSLCLDSFQKTEEITRSSPLTIDTNYAVPLDRAKSTTTSAVPRVPDTTTRPTTTTQRSTTTRRRTTTTTTTENYLDKLEENIHEILVNHIDRERDRDMIEEEDRRIKLKINRILRNEYEDLELENLDHLRGSDLSIDRDLWSILEGRTEIALGICAALTLFLVIVIMFIFRMRRTRQVLEKESLIGNQIEAGFLPAVPQTHSSTQTIHV